MATVDDFILIFPEFASRDAAQLSKVLALVDARISETFKNRDEVVYWEMADVLAAGGQGRQARRGQGLQQSSYSAKLGELVEAHAIGRRVAFDE